MSASSVPSWPPSGTAQSRLQQHLGTGFAFLPLLCGLLPIWLYQHATTYMAWARPDLATPAVLVLAALCLLFAFVRYPAEGRAARIVAAGLGMTLGIFGFALGESHALVDQPRAEALGDVIAYGRILALAAGILSIWRPSFAVFPAVYFAFHKDVSRAVSQAHELGRNDYAPLIEVSIFLTCGLIALGLLQLLARARSSAAKPTILSEIGTATFATRCAAILLLAGIGAHFGNYFLSGLAKVTLDGGPLSWILENPTSAIMLGGYELGAAPLSFSPWLFTTAYEGIRAVELPMNVVVLAAQLFCVAAFLRRRWLIGLTAFFDLMHIGIFLLSGALFLHWIVLNTLIVAALTRLKEKTFPVGAVVAGVAATIAGHNVFYIAELGWYDSRQIRHGYYEAFTEDGRQVPLAQSFLRDSSYLLFGRHFGYREHVNPSGHVPTGAWGQIGIKDIAPFASGTASSNYEIMRLTKDCAYPVDEPETPPDYDTDRPAPFIKAQHRRALALENSNFSIDHNIYPHHHYSMPFRYQAFEAIAPRGIVAYRYVVETVCLGVVDGRVERRVMTRTVGPVIDVRN
jgi:hypothetical protein